MLPFLPPNEAFVVPMGVVVLIIAGLVMTWMALTWNGGPPRWAVRLSMFGAAAGITLVAWVVAYFAILELVLEPTKTMVEDPYNGEMQERYTADGTLVGILAWSALLIPPWLSFRAQERWDDYALSLPINRHGCVPAQRFGPLYGLGAGVGVACGVGAGVLLIFAALLAAVAFAAVIAFVWVFFSLVLIAGVTMVRN